MTAFAIELTWPGVPVTACASMRPWRSKTPADRSPASRTDVENAVRNMVCACSSTTAISRFHMIWVWICASAALGRATMTSNLAAGERNIAELVELRLEQRTDDSGGVVLGNHCRAGNLYARRQIAPPIDRHVLEFAALRIEQRTVRARLRFARLYRHRFCELALRRRAHRHHPAQDLDVDAGNRPAI